MTTVTKTDFAQQNEDFLESKLLEADKITGFKEGKLFLEQEILGDDGHRVVYGYDKKRDQIVAGTYAVGTKADIKQMKPLADDYQIQDGNFEVRKKGTPTGEKGVVNKVRDIASNTAGATQEAAGRLGKSGGNLWDVAKVVVYGAPIIAPVAAGSYMMLNHNFGDKKNSMEISKQNKVKAGLTLALSAVLGITVTAVLSPIFTSQDQARGR